MWDNAMLKENAKRMLAGYYWIAIAASLIFGLLAGGMIDQIKSGFNTSGFLAANGISDYSNSGLTPDQEQAFKDFEAIIEEIQGQQNLTPDQSQAYANELTEIFEKLFADVSADEIAAVVTAIVVGLVVAALLSMIFKLLYSLLFANPLTVGHNRFYLDARMGDAKVGNLFSQFKSGAFGNTVKIMFIKSLKLWLWGLLGIIPVVIAIIPTVGAVSRIGEMDSINESQLGSLALEIIGYVLLGAIGYFIFTIPKLVKTYSYLLVPYIVAENPTISSKRAFEISIKTMNGEKLKFFGLSLSFIGWYMLAALAGSLVSGVLGQAFAGIGTVIGLAFLNPYVYATYTEFYCCMREKALAQNIAGYDELNGVFGKVAAGTPFPDQSSFTGAPYQQNDPNANNAGSYPAYPGSDKKDFDNPYTKGAMDVIHNFPDPEPEKNEFEEEKKDDVFTKSDGDNNNNNLW